MDDYQYEQFERINEDMRNEEIPDDVLEQSRLLSSLSTARDLAQTGILSAHPSMSSFPIKECEVVPLLLSDNGFVRNFGGRERVCSFIDIFEKRYGGLDRLVAAFHEGKESASFYGNRTVKSLLCDLEYNSDANKGLDIRYDDLVSLYRRISECCGVKDNAHFALPQRISFDGKQFIMPGYGVIDFQKVEEINGHPVFFGRNNRLKRECVFSFEGKLLDYSTVYEPFSVLECGDVRLLCKTVVTDWDYMLTNELLKNYDGKILLRGKHFHWDTEKGCLSVLTLAGKVKTMSSEELKGLLKPRKDRQEDFLKENKQAACVDYKRFVDAVLKARGRNKKVE